MEKKMERAGLKKKKKKKREIASDSTKDRRRNLKNTSDVLTTAQGPVIVTSVYTSIYRKIFN